MTRRAWYSERRNYSDIRHRYTSKTIRLRLPRRQVCAARVAVTAAPTAPATWRGAAAPPPLLCGAGTQKKRQIAATSITPLRIITRYA